MKGTALKPEEKKDILDRLIAGEEEAGIAKRYHVCVATICNIRDLHIDEIPCREKKKGTDSAIAGMLKGWDKARIDFLRRHGA